MRTPGAGIWSRRWAHRSRRHGRDNCVQVWKMPESVLGWGGALDPPERVLRIDVNALNYCAYDMAFSNADALCGWMAVPNTLESAWIDVYALPSCRRVAQAVGRQGVLGRGLARPPIVMALCLVLEGATLRLAAGYEDGSLQAWSMATGGSTLEPELGWSHRPHTESVMAVHYQPQQRMLLSVGADARLAYMQLDADAHATPRMVTLPRPGNACVAARWDGRIVAVGGWDGAVRVLSEQGMLLGTLAYHKEGIQSLAYWCADPVHTLALPEAESDEEAPVAAPHVSPHWLAAGAQDGRISLWDAPFTRDDPLPAQRAR